MARELRTANDIWIDLQAEVDALPAIRDAAKIMIPGDRLGLAGKVVTLDRPRLLAKADTSGCNWDLTHYQGLIPGGWDSTIQPLIDAAKTRYSMRTVFDPPPAAQLKKK
jgi:hypothetical protein